MAFLITFITLSIINVVFSTVRTIVTVKGNKWVASLLSAGYFAFYNIMLIYTVADFPMWEKCLITFICNFIGVAVVKFVEEKMRKDRLWKVEMTVRTEEADDLETIFDREGLSFNSIDVAGDYTVFNIYCSTQKESHIVRETGKMFNAKFFVAESKVL